MSQKLRTYIRDHHLSLLCLFLILSGGTAYAVDGPLPGQNQVGSADIINGEVMDNDIGAGAVGNGKLKADAVSANKVVDGTLTGADIASSGVGAIDISNGAFRSEDIRAQFSGFSKAYGIPPDAIQSDEISNGTVQRVDLAAEATGPAGFSAFKNDTGLMCNTGLCTEGTLAPLPAGSYVIFAKIIVEAKNVSDAVNATCRLVAGGDSDLASIWQEGAIRDRNTLPMQVVHTFTATGSAAVECGDSDLGNASGSALKITAVRLGSLSNVGL